MTASSPESCPRCGATASGNFCAACGAALGTPTCATCGTQLSSGARFCHKCGAAVNGPATIGQPATVMTPAHAAGRVLVPMPASDRTPWLIAAVLTVVAIAAVLYSANKRAEPAIPSMANAGNAVAGTVGDTGASGVPTGRAPDISKLTPKEQFARLEQRIDQMLEKGDTANLAFFMQMALQAYANLPAADRDIDTRYHAAMLEAQIGMFDGARALADTIMTAAPDNLFGYYIRATVAEFAGDSTAARAARAAFRTHYDAEMKKNRPEYAEHRPFLEQYRHGDGAN